MDFGQVNLHLYANSIEGEALRNKLLSEYGISHAEALGYCYGLSNEYLIYAGNNQHIDYIKQLNALLDVVNNHEIGQDALSQARSDALKIHAKALLNEFVFDAAKHQSIYENSVRNHNYFQQATDEDINGRSFKDYINHVINTTYEDGEFKGEYYKSVIESQRIKTEKYYSALIADDDFFKSKEGLEISKDPLFIKLKEHFSDINGPIDKNFTTHDAKIFLKVIFNDIQRDNYTKAESFNALRGMKRDRLHKGSKYDNHFKKEVSLNKFIIKLNNETRHGHNPLRYKFCSETHVMAITADFNTATKSWDFTFFDPISGIKKYDNQEAFFDFLKDFVLEKSDGYNFDKLKNNDFKIGYYKYNYEGNVNLRELNESEIKITENALLAERKVSVDINGRDKIVYKYFNPENNLIKVKVKAKINGKSFYIYTDIIDSYELKHLIETNTRTLSELGGDIFISRNEGFIYKVNENFDIKDVKVESNVILDVNNTKVDYKDVNLHLRAINPNDIEVTTGIPELHQQAIMKVANEENIIIGIRPVDKKSASLILSGEYSSKGLKIKSKSSDWGAHCGFIPILQEYAKRSGRENKNKYNSYAQQAIDDGHAKSTILELTPERVNELTVYNEITPLEKVNGSEYSKTTSLLDGQEKIFWLKKINRDGKYFWHVYHEEEGNIKPFHVIADPVTGKALTADYDLFTVIFPFSELEHYVKMAEMPSWSEWKSNVIYDELTPEQKKLYNNESEYNKKEGQDNGITNKRIKEINKKLNNKIGRQEGFELIHHGADDANPASSMNDNFPITFFLPEELKGRNKLSGTSESIDTYFIMNSQGAIIINDIEQLSNFQQLLINQGYRAPLNKKWSEGDLAQYFDKKRKISATHIKKTAEIRRKMSIPAGVNYGHDHNIEKVLGNPVAQLDSGFDDVYIHHISANHTEALAGEQSQSVDSLNKWLDPMLRYRLDKQKDAETNRTVKPTKHNYNVIIQIEGDKASTGSTARAFSKHPEDSMVIQYDIKTKQYKILHGNLNRLNAENIRWITIGHGDYKGNNQPTLYAGVNAQQFSDAIYYLQKKILTNTKPSKVVLIGCNLGRGGIEENFALKATLALSEHNIIAPITSYNRLVKNIYLGNKFVVNDIDSSDSIPAYKHKFIYQFDSESQGITVNKKSAALYFINQLRQEEITLFQLENSFELDPLMAFRNPETRELNHDLIKKVAYSPEGYRLFIDELKQHHGELPESFYADFSSKVEALETPIWKMVESKRIQRYASLMPAQNSPELTVVLRTVNDPKALATAEKLAARNPKNTLIFQLDPDSNRRVLEYGSEEMLSLLENQKKGQGILIGDNATFYKPAEPLVTNLARFSQQHPFLAPEQILFHSISPRMITDAGEHKKFTIDLSLKLKQLGIEAPVVSKFIYTENTEPTQPMRVSTRETLATKAEHFQLQILFEKLAINELSLEDIYLVDHPYLTEYFSDGDGNLDIKKMGVILYDPLINPKVNQFFNQSNDNHLLSWDAIFESSSPKNYQQQAADINTLLCAIKSDLLVLNNLSDHSIELLKSLFPSDNGFDKGKVVDLVTDHNQFMLFSEKLKGFSQISDSHFDGDSAPLKGLSFYDAVHVYGDNQALRLTQYNQLLSYQNRTETGYHAGLVNHGIIRSNKPAQSIDQTLGVVYAIEYHLTDSYAARNFLEQKAQLEHAKQQGILTDSGEALLDKMQQYEQDINTRVKNSGFTIEDQSISTLFASEADSVNGIVFLKGELASYTVVHVKRNGVYEFSLFDPQGIQFTSENASLQTAKHQFSQHLKSYFNQTIELADGQSISRGAAAGFQLTSNGDFRADLQFINLENNELKATLSEPLINER